ncbi:MAG: hypothetical protein Q7R88_02585 [bacterium]|nr:hypothetical protein [bacterium]
MSELPVTASRIESVRKMPDIIAPAGARIHILRVNVLLDQPWHEALETLLPYNGGERILNVGNCFVPTGAGEEEQEHILLNHPAGKYNAGYHWELAQNWAVEEGFTRTVPREVFAIGRQYPELHKELGLNSMRVVATTDRNIGGEQACFVRWYCGKREAGVALVHQFSVRSDWFAFRR